MAAQPEDPGYEEWCRQNDRDPADDGSIYAYLEAVGD